MAFRPEEILEEFVEAGALPREPKLKRRWWWKPNAQLTDRPWDPDDVPQRLRDHERDHPTYKVGCNICWVRAADQTAALREDLKAAEQKVAELRAKVKRSMSDEPEKKTYSIQPRTVSANAYTALEIERSGAIRLQARYHDEKGGVLIGRTKQEVRAFINVLHALSEETPAERK